MDKLNLLPALPEIFLMVAASAILLIDLFLPASRRIVTYVLSLLALLVCGALSVVAMNASSASVYTFHGMFVADPMAHVLKLASYLAVGLSLIYARRYITDRGMVSGNLGGEFFVLALFALLGQMVMISGANFIVIYLGVELLSLSRCTRWWRCGVTV